MSSSTHEEPWLASVTNGPSSYEGYMGVPSSHLASEGNVNQDNAGVENEYYQGRFSRVNQPLTLPVPSTIPTELLVANPSIPYNAQMMGYDGLNTFHSSRYATGNATFDAAFPWSGRAVLPEADPGENHRLFPTEYDGDARSFHPYSRPRTPSIMPDLCNSFHQQVRIDTASNQAIYYGEDAVHPAAATAIIQPPDGRVSAPFEEAHQRDQSICEIKLEDSDGALIHSFTSGIRSRDTTTVFNAVPELCGADSGYLDPNSMGWAGVRGLSRSSSCSSSSALSNAYHERTSRYTSSITSSEDVSATHANSQAPMRGVYLEDPPDDKPVIKSKVATSAIEQASQLRRKNPAKWLCETCGSTFTRRNNLKGHTTSHKGERPYRCQFPRCDRSFARASDRKRHTKTVHKDDSYVEAPSSKFGLSRSSEP